MVVNEFTGLDPHDQYHNAFSRLLKWDPLGRVLMLGTDQRDQFIPELRRAIADFVPAAGAVFDFGCGDGQTLALAIDAFPAGTRISFEDPNPDYIARYRRMVASRSNLELGVALLCSLLGMPQNRFASIHVVGTNGKTSVSRMTSALLEGHGVTTGAYLSPHILSWRERIQIRGEPISEPAFDEAVERAEQAAEAADRAAGDEGPVTQYELLTAAAFLAFAGARVQFAVIEAGLDAIGISRTHDSPIATASRGNEAGITATSSLTSRGTLPAGSATLTVPSGARRSRSFRPASVNLSLPLA